MPDETEKDRIDRELRELLEELRVALPGVQVLFAFLLTVAFTDRIFAATHLQRTVYFLTLVVTAASTALLMSPTAYHRLNFRADARVKERMLFTCTRLAIAGLALLLLALSGVVFLVGDVLYKTTTAAAIAAVVMAWFGNFWFVLPLLRRAKGEK